MKSAWGSRKKKAFVSSVSRVARLGLMMGYAKLKVSSNLIISLQCLAQAFKLFSFLLLLYEIIESLVLRAISARRCKAATSSPLISPKPSALVSSIVSEVQYAQFKGFSLSTYVLH